MNYNNLKSDILSIIRKIEKDNFKPSNIVGITRGGLIPAIYLSHWYEIPLTTLKVSFKDHIHADRIKLPENSLVIDDICDSGETFFYIKEINNNIKFAALIHNISNNFNIDYYGTEINKKENPNLWVKFQWENWWKED